jgi:aromatic-L-amino-acid decarboxylase
MLFDYGFELSRGFKALKIWMSIKEQGVAKFGRLIDQNIRQGAYLTDLIAAEPDLELTAPTAINIVCFRYCIAGATEERLKDVNTEIMLRIQEAGTAVPTDTTVHGKHCLRAAVNNHRTRFEDLDPLVSEVVRLGDVIKQEYMLAWELARHVEPPAPNGQGRRKEP